MKHFLGLDASTLRTGAFELTSINVEDTIEAQAMSLFFGDAGLGKTFAVESALRDERRSITRVAFARQTTPRALVATLLKEVSGIEHHGTQARLEPRLVEALSDQERVLFIDEAQWLNPHCIEYLRHLYDHPATRMSVLLVGGNGCYPVIKRFPMLDSRIYRWTRFSPLARDEVGRLIPHFHTIYRAADPALIERIDDEYADGRLREWAKVTHAVLPFVNHAHGSRLNDDAIDAALHLLGMRQPAA